MKAHQIANRHPMFRDRDIHWRAPDEYGMRKCSYCGSLHPDDLLRVLKTPGTHYSGSDWKYGWPHKFYIEPVNPKAEELVEVGGATGDGTDPLDRWRCHAHGEKPCECPKEKATGYWQRAILGKRPTLFCKWYNEHLEDMTDEQFQEFSQISKTLFGVEWHKDPDKGIGYKARRGHQSAGVVFA